MEINQKCDLCDSTKFEALIDRKGPSMLSDRKIIKKNLKKIECMRCGLVSYAVIEHTPSPKNFLRLLSNYLNHNGLLVIGQPNQDESYYDIFFWDHFFHFSSRHIDDFGRHVNLIPIKKLSGRWPVDSF